MVYLLTDDVPGFFLYYLVFLGAFPLFIPSDKLDHLFAINPLALLKAPFILSFELIDAVSDEAYVDMPVRDPRNLFSDIPPPDC